MFRPLPIEYLQDSRYLDATKPPFDGNPVLVKSNTGVVEAWWQGPEESEGPEGKSTSGFSWVCYDDAFELELEDVISWMPIPEDSVQ